MNNRKLTAEEFDKAINYLNDLEQATGMVNEKHHIDENCSPVCHLIKENLSYQFVKNLAYTRKYTDIPVWKLNIYLEDKRIAEIDSENAVELKLKLARWMIENSELLEGSDEETV